jgi:hypothetical protein
VSSPIRLANDYKTLWLATLGGCLEFYDFIIFVFFAKIIGDLFFNSGNDVVCFLVPPSPVTDVGPMIHRKT